MVIVMKIKWPGGAVMNSFYTPKDETRIQTLNPPPLIQSLHLHGLHLWY